MRAEVHEPKKEAFTGKEDLAAPNSLDSRYEGLYTLQCTSILLVVCICCSHLSLILDSCCRNVEKSENKLCSDGMKKLISVAVAVTHKPVECSELLDEKDIDGQGKIESLAKFSKRNSLSETDSVDSRLLSYPVNHRYQNCRESDDEEDGLEYEESGMESEDDEYTLEMLSGPNSSDHNLKSKVAHQEQQTQPVTVDASLSNWLPSPEIRSQGSFSPENLEDRPILGALTVEELELISTKSSPRSSPNKSPDNMAIIGSVESLRSSQETGSVSSYKGIPNTTSKYREVLQNLKTNLIRLVFSYIRVCNEFHFFDVGAGQESELAFNPVRNKVGESFE